MDEFTRKELLEELKDCANYANGLDRHFTNAIKSINEHGTFDSKEILYQLRLFDHLKLLVEYVNRKEE